MPTKYKSKLLNEFYPRIENAMGNSSKLNRMKRYIEKYIDNHSDQLNYIAPTKRLIFSKDGPDGNIIMDTVDINRREMEKVIKSIPELNRYADVVKDPLFVTLALIIRYLNENNKKRDIDIFLMYLTFALYSSIQYRTFKYEPNENVVQYTISRISNKFYFKQYGTVFKAMHQVAVGLNENNASTLVRDSDKDIIDYIMFLRSRISNTVIKFASELYKDIEEGKYINLVADDTSEENYNEVGNISGNIENLTNKIALTFLQNRLDRSLVSMTSSLSSVNSQFLYSTLEDIKNNERDNVIRVIRDILIIYLKDNKNEIESIGTRKFINYTIKIYSKSNTNDEQVLDIKRIMDLFLNSYSDKYTQTEREATKIKYRKSVFTFFVLLISRYA